MADQLTAEDNDRLISETVPGIAEASTLNDVSVVPITKETFDTNPVFRNWQIGTEWSWDSTNQRMQKN